MKKTFMVTIETDDKNIAAKYPNFRYNWDSPEDFIRETAFALEDKMTEDSRGSMQPTMKLYGYRVTVKENK